MLLRYITQGLINFKMTCHCLNVCYCTYKISPFSLHQLLTNYYKLLKGTTPPPPPPTTTSTTGTASTATNISTAGVPSITEPFSISTALSLSMGTSDELDQSISELTGLTGLTGEESTRPEVIIDEIPESIPVDIRAKLAVCMIQLKYILPKVHINSSLSLLLLFPISFKHTHTHTFVLFLIFIVPPFCL